MSVVQRSQYHMRRATDEERGLCVAFLFKVSMVSADPKVIFELEQPTVAIRGEAMSRRRTRAVSWSVKLVEE